MQRAWIMAALAAGTTLFAQTPPPAATPAPAPAESAPSIEKLGAQGRDMWLVPVEAPGFDKLKPTQRKFAYYLYRAALAGDEIGYLQNHPKALDIKNLLEGVWSKKDALDESTRAGLGDYLKLVWANHGNYSHTHATKFLPASLTYDQLRKAVQTASKKGAKFPFKGGAMAELARLKPYIFDASVDPIQVNQVPGQDPIATSANGLYDKGLTLKDIQALPAATQQQLNVRFAKKGRKAVAQAFKVGGVYGAQLDTVVFWLQKALPYVEDQIGKTTMPDGTIKTRFEANPDQREALEDLIAFFKTGDEATFKKHSIAWLKTKSTIDYLNGFYEVYKDPRSVIGAYEANVSYQSDSAVIGKLSQSAAYFEAKMPWDAKWQRAQITPPVASVVNVLMETGDGGPISPAAYNLPNYADIRTQYGSKNVVLLNVEGASGAATREANIQAFYRGADQDLVRKFGQLGRQWLVYMHEVIGHGSGQPDASLKGADPSVLIGPTYSALEECRADCVALYQFPDPKLEEIGGVSAADHAGAYKAMLLSYLEGQYVANGLVEGDTIHEAHLRGRQLVLNYLIDNQKGVEVDQADGHGFVAVTDAAKARVGVGEVLNKLQTLKAMGDQAGAEAFFSQYGTKVNHAWHDDAKARLDALNLPKEKAFVFPKLVPVVEDINGRQILKDVKVETGESFEDQMLRVEAWGKSRELDPSAAKKN
jgi:dipeptidyl-peptidase-3